MSVKKDVEQLIHVAQDQGWHVTKTKGSHWKWTSPQGAIVFSGQTPSDLRALKNIKRELRLRGFIELKPKRKKNEQTQIDTSQHPSQVNKER
jgi:predicted RNA binding protein YcfA (HicA-like mRNA interferase family)